jgi:tetratricopeptide (TPR) repeat protein
MSTAATRTSLRLMCVAAAAILGAASASRAQITSQNGGPNLMQESNSMEQRLYVGTADTQADREQDAAYQAFLKERDPAKRIRLGNEYLNKFPKSALAERVDVGLMNAYRAERDWKNSFRFGDNALALDPDDVDVLATVGWTIPHVYNPNDADADQELKKAETYAKHAIDVMARMAKPKALTDAQFAEAKARRTFQAHSALGIVYFRRDDYDNSAKELAQATQGNPAPDPTDLFILGVDLQNLNRYGEAADAFSGCGRIAGPLQEQCKQGADSAKARAEQAKPK